MKKTAVIEKPPDASKVKTVLVNHPKDMRSFGEKQLARYGWKAGQGVGKQMQGREKPLPLNLGERKPQEALFYYAFEVEEKKLAPPDPSEKALDGGDGTSKTNNGPDASKGSKKKTDPPLKPPVWQCVPPPDNYDPRTKDEKKLAKKRLQAFSKDSKIGTGSIEKDDNSNSSKPISVNITEKSRNRINRGSLFNRLGKETDGTTNNNCKGDKSPNENDKASDEKQVQKSLFSSAENLLSIREQIKKLKFVKSAKFYPAKLNDNLLKLSSNITISQKATSDVKPDGKGESDKKDVAEATVDGDEEETAEEEEEIDMEIYYAELTEYYFKEEEDLGDPAKLGQVEEGFVPVLKKDLQVTLSWPEFMIKKTTTQPALAYSVNPLSYEFKSKKGKSKEGADGLKKKHKKKSKKKRKKKKKKKKTKKHHKDDSKDNAEKNTEKKADQPVEEKKEDEVAVNKDKPDSNKKKPSGDKRERSTSKHGDKYYSSDDEYRKRRRKSGDHSDHSDYGRGRSRRRSRRSRSNSYSDYSDHGSRSRYRRRSRSWSDDRHRSSHRSRSYSRSSRRSRSRTRSYTRSRSRSYSRRRSYSRSRSRSRSRYTRSRTHSNSRSRSLNVVKRPLLKQGVTASKLGTNPGQMMKERVRQAYKASDTPKTTKTNAVQGQKPKITDLIEDLKKSKDATQESVQAEGKGVVLVQNESGKTQISGKTVVELDKGPLSSVKNNATSGTQPEIASVKVKMETPEAAKPGGDNKKVVMDPQELEKYAALQAKAKLHVQTQQMIQSQAEESGEYPMTLEEAAAQGLPQDQQLQYLHNYLKSVENTEAPGEQQEDGRPTGFIGPIHPAMQEAGEGVPGTSTPVTLTPEQQQQLLQAQMQLQLHGGEIRPGTPLIHLPYQHGVQLQQLPGHPGVALQPVPGHPGAFIQVSTQQPNPATSVIRLPSPSPAPAMSPPAPAGLMRLQSPTGVHFIPTSAAVQQPAMQQAAGGVTGFARLPNGQIALVRLPTPAHAANAAAANAAAANAANAAAANAAAANAAMAAQLRPAGAVLGPRLVRVPIPGQGQVHPGVRLVRAPGLHMMQGGHMPGAVSGLPGGLSTLHGGVAGVPGGMAIPGTAAQPGLPHGWIGMPRIMPQGVALQHGLPAGFQIQARHPGMVRFALPQGLASAALLGKPLIKSAEEASGS